LQVKYFQAFYDNPIEKLAVKRLMHYHKVFWEVLFTFWERCR